ncbi:MAG: DUF5103 domain-containing protein [Bacteroidia bacterium]|nr:DUF5103 domain-containing protein [Bacteroidia bacterium]
MLYRFALLLLAVTSPALLEARVFRDSIYKDNIATVQLLREGKPSMVPFVQLHSAETFSLHFDDLNAGSDVYNYTMVMCNYDWTPSPLEPIMYLNGFMQANITQMDFSMGTKQSYTHYSIDFPNADMRPKMSGNYALVVFRQYDNTDTVFVKRFRVVEPLLNITGRTRDAINAELRLSSQDVVFEMDLAAIQNVNPRMDIFVDILQDGREDNARRGVKPAIQVGTQLTFDNLDNSATFPGGNEWRFLDLRTLRQKTNITRELTEKNGLAYSQLFALPSRGNTEYSPLPDLNGVYYIETRDGFNNNTDGDYSYVRFALAYDESPQGMGDVYVMGQMSNYQLSPEWKMDYDYDRREFFLEKKLKTGYYNFMFLNTSPYASYSHTRKFEGDFARTENTYVVLVYYRDRYQRNDRLIGVAAFNTILDR